MSNFRHVASAPALASSTPDRSCTTDLVTHIHISTGANQGLNDFEKPLLDGKRERGPAVLTWGRVGAHGREGTKEGVSYEQLSPCRPGSCARFEHTGSIMYY